MRRKCSILPTLLLNLSGRGACFYAMYSHQNEDKSLDIRFEMNGEFNGTVRVFIEPTEELESA